MNDDKKSETKYVMVESGPSVEEDEIDLLELIRTLLQAWKLIVAITTTCTVLAVVYALLAQEMFKAEILLAPVQEGEAGIASSLSKFGGLAAMAGKSIPSNSNVARVLATMQSREFLWEYIVRNKLLPFLFENLWDEEKKTWILDPDEKEPSHNDACSAFLDLITIDEDKESGLITFSILWSDPEIAAQWANDLVRQLNEQLRKRAIQDSKKRIGYLEKELAKTTVKDMREVVYNLLESEKQKAMLANVNEDFALEVIDPAVAPEVREKPKRILLVVLGGVCGITLGIFVVFLKNLKPSRKENTNTSHA